MYALHSMCYKSDLLQGMSMIISRSQLSPTEESPVAMETNAHQHNWLLVNFPALPMFPQVKSKTCAALRQVC